MNRGNNHPSSYFILFLFLLCSFGIPLHCFAENYPSYSGAYPIKIVSTTGMVSELVRAVGGEKVAVSTIIPTGGDPHLYVASPKDVLQFLKADIIFYSGLFLEGRMVEFLEKHSRKKPTFAVSKSIPEKFLLHSEQFHGHPDPHVWMDVSLWKIAGEEVLRVLQQMDPTNAKLYEENAKSYFQKLNTLHTIIGKLIATIPASQRVLVTAHDAFGYFGKAYGLSVRGVQGISTESEAGLKDINDLVNFIVQAKIQSVFVETSVAEKNVLALVEGAKAKGHEVKLGGTLFSDSMGAGGTKEGTYLGMIIHNVITIVQGLGGKASTDDFLLLEKS